MLRALLPAFCLFWSAADACAEQRVAEYMKSMDMGRTHGPSCGRINWLSSWIEWRLRRDAVESAAHLVDHVFPEAPVRQLAPTFPFPPRFLFAARPEALDKDLSVVRQGVSTLLIRNPGLTVSSGARSGAVTRIAPG